MALNTQDAAIGDVVLWETDSRFTRVVDVFENDSGGTLSYQPGLVCERNVGDTAYVEVATAASADSILLEVITDLADSGTIAAIFLLRGPLLLNHDGLNYNAATEATVDAALLALNMLVVPNPTYGT